MNFSAFVSSLPIMGKGLLGIFAVIAVIALLIVVLNRSTGRKSPKK